MNYHYALLMGDVDAMVKVMQLAGRTYRGSVDANGKYAAIRAGDSFVKKARTYILKEWETEVINQINVCLCRIKGVPSTDGFNNKLIQFNLSEIYYLAGNLKGVCMAMIRNHPVAPRPLIPTDGPNEYQGEYTGQEEFFHGY